MLEALLLSLGGFAAGCCSSWAGRRVKRKVRFWNPSLSAARKGRTLLSPRHGEMSPRTPRSPSKATATSAAESRASAESDRDAPNLWRKARYMFGNILQVPQPKKVKSSREVAQPDNWRGRIWSFKLKPGGSATVEARFVDDGVHWIVIMKDRGPGIDVKAILLTADGEHELEHETGQSFHGQTALCDGEAVLQLHFRNGHASFTERQVEVKMFPFHSGARIGEHSFVHAVMLKWITDVVQRSFLKRDVKLNADNLSVVEVERVMHDQLWDRYVRRRKSILMKLSQSSNEHFAHSATRCEIITDALVPLPLSQAANEHWLFHGTSAENVVSIFEEGFQDQPQLAHGAAFGSGIYFTECSSKADMYTEPAEHTEVHDHGGLCCMLMCRVTLGRARKLDSEFHVDKKQLQEVMSSGQYHSILADRERLFSSYREFVTPADQVYPEFLIWYERTHKSAMQQWKERNWGGDLF